MAKKKKDELEIFGIPVFQTIRMAESTAAAEGWSSGAAVIVLQNGVSIYAGADPEGNDHGALFGNDKDGDFQLAGDQRDGFLKGKKIKAIGKLSQSSMDEMMWYGESPAVLEFEDGTRLWPSRDDEGNGPGTLIARTTKGKTFYLVAQGPKDWSPL
jgi:hypothetical protein